MININTQSSFFKNKLNVNMSMMLDPYKTEFCQEGTGNKNRKVRAFSIANFNAQLSLPLSEAILGRVKTLQKNIKARERSVTKITISMIITMQGSSSHGHLM